MKESAFSGKIVEWYLEHHRSLPWRQTRNAYRIWLSEIILQQTRVAQGLPYYRAFIKKYPTVQALAAAREQAVLRLWQGLGYYTRARNLHACAKTVVKLHRGKFPNTYDQLRQLKGIGDYTAAAVASFAFDEPVAVVDGNVFRVLARVFGLTDDIGSPAGRKKFSALANQLISVTRPALHNQAIMEFGALQCTPRNPKCDECPLQRDCLARRQGMEAELPVKRSAPKQQRRTFYYFAIRAGSRWLMKQRKGKDIWQGLWDFVLLEGNSGNPAATIAKKLRLPVRVRKAMVISPVYRHALSHQMIHARFVEIVLPPGMRIPDTPIFSDTRFLSPRQIAHVPKPVLVTQYLAQRGVR